MPPGAVAVGDIPAPAFAPVAAALPLAEYVIAAAPVGAAVAVDAGGIVVIN